MGDLSNAFQEFNLSKYEALALETLIKFGHLDARNLATKSQVPQPKIYETIDKLEEKGLVEIIQQKGKKIFQIKPKSNIRKYFSSKINSLQEIQNNIDDSIDDLYHSDKEYEVGLFGVAGKDHIIETIENLVQTAESNINIAIPFHFFTKKLFQSLNSVNEKVNINIIYQKSSQLQEIAQKIPHAKVFQMRHQGFSIAQKILKTGSHLIPPDGKKSFGYSFIAKIMFNLEKIFGILVIDEKQSLFLIPMYLKQPIAMVTSEPEIVSIHTKGLKNIIQRGIPILTLFI